jgi:hypothetical protein
MPNGANGTASEWMVEGLGGRRRGWRGQLCTAEVFAAGQSAVLAYELDAISFSKNTSRLQHFAQLRRIIARKRPTERNAPEDDRTWVGSER